MKKGRTLVRRILLFLYFQAFCLGGNIYAQIDSNKVFELEIFDCYAFWLTPKTEIEFDSLTRASNNTIDAGEFLNQNTNTYIKDYGPGSTSTLSYRGNSASHTKVYWEGMSVDNAQLGLTDLSLMNFGNFTTASFSHAGYSLEQGSGGFGGILNVGSDRNGWDRFKARTGVSYGSFNTRSIPIDFLLSNKKSNIKFESSFNYTASDNDYDFVNYLDQRKVEKRENAGYERFQWMPSLNYRLNNKHFFKIGYWYLDSKREVPSAIETSHGNAVQLDVWNRLKASYSLFANRNLNLNVNSMIGEDYMNYENESLRIQSENKVQSFKNMMFAGYDLASKWKAESQIRADFQKVITNNYDSDKEQNLLSFYQSVSYVTARWYFKALTRVESFDGADPVVLPAFNFGLRPTSKSTYSWLLFNVAYNMRYPTFNERFWLNAGNPNLKNESSVSTEIALDQEYIPFRKKKRLVNISYRIALFYSRISNLIAWSPESNGTWIPKNIKSVENSGIEAEGRIKWNKSDWKRQLNFGYMYTNSRIKEDAEFPEFNGKQQMYIPEHKAHVMLYLEYKGIFASYSQSLTGAVYIDSDNEVYLPENSPAKLEIGKHIRFQKSTAVLSFRINNLYNEEYQYVAHMPMPLQNYSINFIYNIN